MSQAQTHVYWCFLSPPLWLKGCFFLHCIGFALTPQILLLSLFLQACHLLKNTIFYPDHIFLFCIHFLQVIFGALYVGNSWSWISTTNISELQTNPAISPWLNTWHLNLNMGQKMYWFYLYTCSSPKFFILYKWQQYQ